MTDHNLSTQVEAGMKAMHAFIEESKKKIDALDETKLTKITDEVTAAVQASQEAKAAQLAQAKQIEAMEAALARPGAGNADETKEKAAKTSALFGEFLKKGMGSTAGDFSDFIERKGLDVKALSVGINQDGGFLVPETFGGIVNVRVFESSPIRQLATVQSVGGAELELVLDNDEAGAGWVGETQSRSETTSPTLDKRVIVTHEMYAEPRATQKLLDDGVVNVEAWLAGKVADKLARLEATAFISGNGVAQPFGILANTTTSTSYNARSVQVVNSGTQGAFTYDGLAALQNSLKEPYQANATFLMKRASFGAIMRIKTGISGDNRPIFNMMYDKNTGIAMSILGRPVMFADDVPAVANDVNAAIYGDFRQAYVIADRIGIRTLRDPYTAKPFVKFYTTKRVGGDVVNAEALKIQALSV